MRLNHSSSALVGLLPPSVCLETRRELTPWLSQWIVRRIGWVVRLRPYPVSTSNQSIKR